MLLRKINVYFSLALPQNSSPVAGIEAGGNKNIFAKILIFIHIGRAFAIIVSQNLTVRVFSPNAFELRFAQSM